MLLPLAILFQEMSALKKRGNKKEQVLGTSKEKKKVRREIKMDKCLTVELGVQDTHLRGKKKRRASHCPQKVSKEQERYVSPQKSKSRIRLSPLSPFIRHTCIS